LTLVLGVWQVGRATLSNGEKVTFADVTYTVVEVAGRKPAAAPAARGSQRVSRGSQSVSREPKEKKEGGGLLGGLFGGAKKEKSESPARGTAKVRRQRESVFRCLWCIGVSRIASQRGKTTEPA
jgi:hypothetical protein